MVKIFLAFVFLFSCSSPDVCSTQQEIHEWTGYRWAPDNYDLSITNTAGSDRWTKLLDETMYDWNSLGSGLVVGTTDENNGDILVRLVQTADYLGQAEIYLNDEGYIARARISLNVGRTQGQYSDNGLRHILCQELGHALGLFHIDGETCMNDCSSFGSDTEARRACIEKPSNSRPNFHDGEQLIIMYGGVSDDCK